ncbi:ionotropic receptor 75a-like [Wyeomyia smithii]|uniref:ionotropic receptor 75a-like n=1 Tax=Wyeomyia smithii TaxID=174621 RepID=UPI002467FEB4|nr:ionotropic receptor 75a-like [Wyeomyia smithii]
MGFLFVLYFLTHSVLALLNVNLMEDYVKWQRLRTVTIFHCLDQNYDILHVSQRMSKVYEGRVHYEDITNLSVDFWNHSHVMRFDYSSLGAVIDTTCAQTVDLFRIISAYEYFNASYYWLIFGNESTTCLLDKQNLNIDAKITLAIAKDEFSRTYSLYDVFSPMRRRGTPLNVTYMGSWSTSHGFKIIVNQTEYERRVDFGGLWLKAAVTTLDHLHNSTLRELLTSKEPVTKFAFYRLGYQIWEHVMLKHNFTFQLIKTWTWNLENVDGRSPKGMVGQVVSKQCDLTVNGLSYRQDRVGTFDNTITILISRQLIIFRHPRKGSARNIFLQPFRIDLWIAVLALIAFASILLFGNFIVESLKSRFSYVAQDSKKLSLLVIIGIVCQQGFAPKTFLGSTRTTLITMLMFSYFLLQFYSTYIVSYLLIAPPKFMNTLRHLIDSDFKVLVENVAYNNDYFNATKDPLAIELYKRKILNGENNFVNITTGIAQVKKGGYAFQCDTGYAYPLIMRTFTDKEICDLQETLLNPIRPLQLPLRKGSPFKQMFRVTLRKLAEGGLLRTFQNQFANDKPKCAKSEQETQPVDLEHVSTLFAALFVSILGSFCGLLLELLHRHVSKRRQNPKWGFS